MQIELPELKMISSDAGNTDFLNKLEKLKELGLEEQIKLGMSEIKKNINPYEEMSNDEYTIWKEFLPTRYSDNNNRKIKDYRFDLIPAVILDRWLEAKRNNWFDYYEIRTTESFGDDPMLLGFIGTATGPDKAYLIGRWGESDYNLLSISDVAKIIQNKRLLQIKEDTKFGMFMTFVGSLFVSAIFFIIISGALGVKPIFSIPALLGLSAIAAIVIPNQEKKKIIKNSIVLKACYNILFKS